MGERLGAAAHPQISGRDIDRLIRTRTHQALLDGVGHLAGSSQQKLVNGLVSLEIEQRVAALQDQLARWPSDVSLLVPDTGFCIQHDAKLLDVDFAALAGTTGHTRAYPPALAAGPCRLCGSFVTGVDRFSHRTHLPCPGP
ncbi:hypothetical protein OG859_39955 [Streptomyces sp. NBC_00048]|uniref:hypothetical protein n=1 Tax=Streptomyces sp. NBC_00048 TaxID=2975628 RepID=UPI0032502BBE